MRYEEIRQTYIGNTRHILNVGDFAIGEREGVFHVYVYWPGPGAYSQLEEFTSLDAAVSYARTNTKEAA